MSRAAPPRMGWGPTTSSNNSSVHIDKNNDNNEDGDEDTHNDKDNNLYSNGDDVDTHNNKENDIMHQRRQQGYARKHHRKQVVDAGRKPSGCTCVCRSFYGWGEDGTESWYHLKRGARGVRGMGNAQRTIKYGGWRIQLTYRPVAEGAGHVVVRVQGQPPHRAGSCTVDGQVPQQHVLNLVRRRRKQERCARQ